MQFFSEKSPQKVVTTHIYIYSLNFEMLSSGMFSLSNFWVVCSCHFSFQGHAIDVVSHRSHHVDSTTRFSLHNWSFPEPDCLGHDSSTDWGKRSTWWSPLVTTRCYVFGCFGPDMALRQRLMVKFPSFRTLIHKITWVDTLRWNNLKWNLNRKLKPQDLLSTAGHL